ncbi:hypothetical protein NO995_10260 [Aestuariibaculum sp. M13]|uniref:hypothetical protein n=1 Tax=Aestuariibaculum sp. M13 TaxID=2967132 RepID=UPI00215A0A8F|nr:hypothetical protein [Aestuariibaculum sp. M13]MCR8668066.1 hypothetical protein [Aestuariibaculum sp. M13]
MIKKVSLLIIMICTISCNQAQTDKHYADDLKGCLNDNDIEILNRATFLFEKMLAEHYGSTNNKANFNTYIEELGSIPKRLNVPLSFYLNDKSVAMIKELESSGTFNKIWIKFVEKENEKEIPIVAASEYEEPESEKLEIYTLNPNGDYLKCINNVSNNEGFKEVLNSQTKYGDIAPTIIAGALKQKITVNDFNNGLNRVIIAIGFYYDMVNLLNKNPR